MAKNKKLEEIIRVDHAGERGAIKIYDGQLFALQLLKADSELEKKVSEMKEHEKEHLKYFEQQLAEKYKTNFVSSFLGYAWNSSWFWYYDSEKKQLCYVLLLLKKLLINIIKIKLNIYLIMKKRKKNY